MSKVNLIIVATINPEEKAAMGYYLEQMGGLYERANAKSVGKYKIAEAAIGFYTPSLVSVMEFPDMAAYNAVFNGPEYNELLPYREKAFLKVEGFLST